MTKLTTIFLSLALLALGACASDVQTDHRASTMRSCFDTGFGLKCISTPDGLQTIATDVNADGTDDPFVCGDVESESEFSTPEDDDDGDDVGDDDGDDDGDDGDDDVESADDGDGDSDEACGTDPDDGDGDGDDDGVSDERDCDCL